MLGEYYAVTGIGAVLCMGVATVTGLFGRAIRKSLPKLNVLKIHKYAALLGVTFVALHVLGVHGF